MNPNTLRAIGAYGGYVLFVHMVDGPWKQWDKGTCVDWWTVTHLACMSIARRMGVPFRDAMVLGVLNEVGEALVRRYRPDLLFGGPEPPCNIVMDLVANYVGYRYL